MTTYSDVVHKRTFSSFIQNNNVSLNAVMSYMRENVPDQEGQLV